MPCCRDSHGSSQLCIIAQLIDSFDADQKLVTCFVFFYDRIVNVFFDRKNSTIMTINGKVQWIGLRPAHDKPMEVVEQVIADESKGLIKDRFKGRGTKRQVTLFEMEFLEAIARIMELDSIGPEQTRRNIGVTGINLHAWMNQEISTGECVLKITDDCYPCERMESTVGPGAMSAMTGLAGVTASIVKGGTIRVGDQILINPEAVDHP